MEAVLIDDLDRPAVPPHHVWLTASMAMLKGRIVLACFWMGHFSANSKLASEQSCSQRQTETALVLR